MPGLIFSLLRWCSLRFQFRFTHAITLFFAARWSVKLEQLLHGHHVTISLIRTNCMRMTKMALQQPVAHVLSRFRGSHVNSIFSILSQQQIAVDSNALYFGCQNYLHASSTYIDKRQAMRKDVCTSRKFIMIHYVFLIYQWQLDTIVKFLLEFLAFFGL